MFGRYTLWASANRLALPFGLAGLSDRAAIQHRADAADLDDA